MNLFPIFFSRRWWWVTLVVILGMIILARLGFWQLDRLEERRAANAILLEQLEAEPISLNDPDLDPQALTAMPDRAVTVSGEFDFSEQVLLTLQNFRGQPGGRLIAPLRIAGREEAVLVDRGWIPAAETEPAQWAQFGEPEAVTLAGTIQQTEVSRRAEPPEGPQEVWYRVNVEAIERQLPYELLPVYIVQAPDGAESSPPYREIPPVDLSEGPHLGYAIQWFLFTLMLGGGYVYLVYSQERAGEELE
ncbi:MAG: SURF1 family protein [Candidatus Promineifilaceae bacterium]|nr:SURF1 family protein [Candidatus Promineifilaceae bacterium]